MTDEQVYAGVEKALRKYFGKRGDQVVQDNLTCVKRGYSEMKEIPAAIDQWRVMPSAGQRSVPLDAETPLTSRIRSAYIEPSTRMRIHRTSHDRMTDHARR